MSHNRTIFQPSYIKELSTNHSLWQLMQVAMLYVGKDAPAILLELFSATDGLSGSFLSMWRHKLARRASAAGLKQQEYDC